MDMRKRGNGLLPPRDETIKVRLAPEERAAIEALASQRGYRWLADYMRDCALQPHRKTA